MHSSRLLIEVALGLASALAATLGGRPEEGKPARENLEPDLHRASSAALLKEYRETMLHEADLANQIRIQEAALKKRAKAPNANEYTLNFYRKRIEALHNAATHAEQNRLRMETELLRRLEKKSPVT